MLITHDTVTTVGSSSFDLLFIIRHCSLDTVRLFEWSIKLADFLLYFK